MTHSDHFNANWHTCLACAHERFTQLGAQSPVFWLSRFAEAGDEANYQLAKDSVASRGSASQPPA